MSNCKKKTGKESFLFHGDVTGFTISDFWSWGASNLLDNTMRGVIAEFIVAKAIDAKEEIRQEWEAYDLTLSNGGKVEVKSSAYLQNWEQEKDSPIRFGIQKTSPWDERTRDRIEAKRQADYYVFCHLKCRDRKKINPIDIDQWDFYVLATEKINQKCREQKTIGLEKIKKLGARALNWKELQKVFTDKKFSVSDFLLGKNTEKID